MRYCIIALMASGKIGDDGFEPRSMFAEPKTFATVGSTPAPRPGVAASNAQYRAAVLQHVAATAVREQLRHRGTNQKDFFAKLSHIRGLSVGRVGRLLRGEQLATLEDIALWFEHLPEGLDRFSAYVAKWDETTKLMIKRQRQELQEQFESERVQGR